LIQEHQFAAEERRKNFGNETKSKYEPVRASF